MPSASRTIKKIVNCQLSIVNCRIGFTLVELLVVMGILGVITGGSLLFLTSILRGSNQARIVAEVKQNGQTILDVIDRQIRNAVSVRALTGAELPSGSLNAVELEVGTSIYVYLSCFDSVGVTANGWIGLVSSTIRSTLATPILQSQYRSLTNLDTISGINVACNSPTFGVSGNSGDPFPQVVQVSFNVKQGVEAPGRVDFNASAEFKTTISLRKYSF